MSGQGSLAFTSGGRKKENTDVVKHLGSIDDGSYWKCGMIYCKRPLSVKIKMAGQKKRKRSWDSAPMWKPCTFAHYLRMFCVLAALSSLKVCYCFALILSCSFLPLLRPLFAPRILTIPFLFTCSDLAKARQLWFLSRKNAESFLYVWRAYPEVFPSLPGPTPGGRHRPGPIQRPSHYASKKRRVEDEQAKGSMICFSFRQSVSRKTPSFICNKKRQ